MRTQHCEVWKRDAQTLGICSWVLWNTQRLNAILKTYQGLPGVEEGDEVVLRCNINDLGKVAHILGLDANYILKRLNEETL